jgi:hypothetical protein
VQHANTRVALPLCSRVQHRQRAPYPLSAPLGLVRCTPFVFLDAYWLAQLLVAKNKVLEAAAKSSYPLWIVPGEHGRISSLPVGIQRRDALRGSLGGLHNRRATAVVEAGCTVATPARHEHGHELHKRGHPGRRPPAGAGSPRASARQGAGLAVRCGGAGACLGTVRRRRRVPRAGPAHRLRENEDARR